jgi:hypothetical protein
MVKRGAGGTGDRNANNKDILHNDSDTWASAHKEDRNIQCVDMLREHPGKQSRRGVCLSFLNDCRRALKTSDSRCAGTIELAFGLGPSYQQVIYNPNDDPTHNPATATQLRK